MRSNAPRWANQQFADSGGIARSLTRTPSPTHPVASATFDGFDRFRTKLCASISDSEAKTCERIKMITPGTLHLRRPRSHRRDTWVSLRTKYPHDSRTRQVAYSSPANPGNRSPGVSSEVSWRISAETPHFSENLL